MSPRLVLLLVAVLVLDGAVGVLLGWRLSGSRGPGGELPRWGAPSSLGVADERTRRARAVERLLDERARALTDRQRKAYLATVDPTRPGLLRRERVLFDRLDGVPVHAWALELESGLRQPRRAPASASGGSTWTAEVSVRHRFAGFDAGWASRQVAVTFTRRGSRWYVAGERALPQQRASDVHTAVVDRSTIPAKDLWQLAPTRVVRRKHTLVVGSGSPASLAAVARETDQQVRRVSGTWGDGWSERVVVLVPHTVRDMATLLGAQPGSLRQIAAVTTGETDPATGRSASRVVVNPAAFADLSPIGRRIVLAHEVTHVAARGATTSRVPTWLAEGLADYVAYRGTGLSTAAIAEELFEEVRAGRVPHRLPVSADFRGTERQLAQSYEMAWLACAFVARQYGPQTLLAFYRATGDEGLTAASRETLRMSPAELTRRWQRYLVERAG